MPFMSGKTFTDYGEIKGHFVFDGGQDGNLAEQDRAPPGFIRKNGKLGQSLTC